MILADIFDTEMLRIVPTLLVVTFVVLLVYFLAFDKRG